MLSTVANNKNWPDCLLTVSVVTLFVTLLFADYDRKTGLSFIASTYAHDFGFYDTPDLPPDVPQEVPCMPSPGVCCESEGSGGKVIYYTGAETFTRTDLTIKGAFPIKLTRKYSSQSEYDSPLGYGWSHNHDFRIYQYSDNSIVLRSGCGIKTKYTFSAEAYQRQPGGLLGNITASNGEYTMSYLNGQVQFFDVQGRLQWWQDVTGNRLEYTYYANDAANDPAGKFPLTGASPYSLDPSQPMTVAYNYQLKRVEERLKGGELSGNYIEFSYHPTTGRITSVQSHDGRTITYAHDTTAGSTLGNLTLVTGLEGLVSTYLYDDRNDSGQIQDYHNITSIQEGTATPLIEKYDEQDRVERETHGNRVIDFSYTIDLLETSTTEVVKDDAGAILNTIIQTFKFDDIGLVTSKLDGEGNETIYIRNALGLIEKEEVFLGTNDSGIREKLIDRTYYTNGRINTEVITLDKGTADIADDETITTTWTYDDTLESEKTIVSSLSPNKVFKTQTIYNHDVVTGKPTTIQAIRRYKDDGVSYLETSYTYNNNNDVLTTTYPDGHVVENEYGAVYSGKYVTRTLHRDVAGQPMTDLEETYEYEIDATGNPRANRTKVIDAKGYFTTTTYDDRNRRETVINHLGHLTSYVYDINGNLSNIIQDRSVVGDQLDNAKLGYDGYNQLISIERTDDAGDYQLRESLRYDSAGNIIARGDAINNASNAKEILLSYDLENRLTRITDAEGNYINYTLDSIGNREKIEYFTAGNVLVRTSSAVFDDLNRQIQLIGAINQTTTFTFDAVGNRITATDALSRPTTEYTYDTLSRLTTVKDANGKDTIYEYDDRDRLRFVIDPRAAQLVTPFKTEYKYNELGQLTKLISPDTGATEYTYDLAGNRQTQQDARNITVTFAYDALNRITSKTYADASLNVTYIYDTGANAIGKLSSMTDKEGSTTYAYDERGNLTTRSRSTNGKTYLTQYAYDLNDRLINITYPSKRVVAYVRNTLGQVVSITTKPKAKGGGEVTIASNLSYLPFGALENMDWGNGLALNQSFDQDYRLTSQVLGTVYSRTYGYDGVNNIKTITDNIATTKNQTFNYDDLDRLDDATGNYGALNYDYDDVGNRISLVVDANPVTNYAYSATSNQLNNSTGTDAHSYTYDENGNAQTKDAFTFTYDQMNRMVQVSDGAVTTTYGFNGKGERVSKSGVLTTLYHYDSSGNLFFESDDSGNAQVEYIWLGNQRLAMVQGNTLYYTHTDHLGAQQLLTDTNANVVWSADYRPFGAVTVNSASTITNNMRFPGQMFDEETGLHYNYYRTMDPATGRYTQSDPIGLSGGYNTYSYALNNPGRYNDFFGLYIDFVCDAILESQKKSYQDNRNKIENGFQFNRDSASRKYQQSKNDCISGFTYCESRNLSMSECEDKLNCQKGYDDCIKGANDFFDSTIDQLLSAYQMQLTNLNNMYPHLGPGNTTECPPVTPKIPRR